MAFSAPTQAWFDSTFASPTPAQARGWAAIERGDHTLILAPTGSGKTLAAFLWALDRLSSAPRPGCQVLYVSPLKALTYDVERNLRAPLAGIAREAARLGVEVRGISVATRTGDTPAEDRRRMATHPPDILVTTPESLYLLLTSRAAAVLASVSHVIVDEIHAVAGTKRGAHLALSLERLEQLCTAPAPRPGPAGGHAAGSRGPGRRGGRGGPGGPPLAPPAGRPPQRIGLSATQRPLDELARFLGGQTPAGPRPVTVVDAGAGKVLELEVVVPVEDMGEPGRAAGVTGDGDDLVMPGPAAGRASIWPAVHQRLLDLVYGHRSTLIFVNSRRLAERLAARLNELHAARLDALDQVPGAGGPLVQGAGAFLGAGAPAELARAHHGSIAREQRLEIEDALKAGRLPALVATSSLELGIDMGAIDLVVQVEAPPSVASGLQRIGRAGHQVGQPSKGRIFPKFRHDLLVAAVVAERMHAGLVEETRVTRNPLDVLAQQLVATVAAADGPVAVADLAALARRSYPFADLSDGAFEGTLDMLAGRYPSDEFAELRPRLVWDRLAGTVTARPGARMLAVVSGGTIPDRGLFGVFTPGGGRVGELDEEMVYESRVGETFILGATTWRIEDITRDRVVVTPAPGVPGKMPFWHGDNLGRPYELGCAVGAFTAELAAGSVGDDELARRCDLDRLAAANLRAYLSEELEATGGVVPTDRQIVVQRFRDELGDWRVAVLSPFGARVHAPWALAIEARLAQAQGPSGPLSGQAQGPSGPLSGQAQGPSGPLSGPVQAVWSDDGIILRMPEADEPPDLDVVLVEPAELDDLVVGAVGSSALFAARFRENAARSLLLPRRRPGSRTPLWQLRQRASDLAGVASRYGEFPILLETYRECLRDAFDLPALGAVMAGVASRRIRVTCIDLAVPSPFASGLVSSWVAAFMYEGDAPLAERRAQALTLDRRMLAELLGSDELRDLLDAGALGDLEAELQALDDRRRARSIDQAADLLRRLGDLDAGELEARCTPEVGPGAAAALVAARRAVPVRVAGEERLIAAEDAGRYRDALGVEPPPGLPEAYLAVVPDALVQLVRRWARTHGPFVTTEPAARFGLAPAAAAAVLDELRAAGRLERGAFRPGGRQEEWCDGDVLAALRQRSLAALRSEVAPAPSTALVRFLPGWHGVAPAGRPPAAGGLDRLWEVVGQLQGLALPASVWEHDVLAVRVRGYQPRMLDELLSAGEVMWMGAGSLGRDDGRVVLARRADAAVLLPRLGLVGDLHRPTGGARSPAQAPETGAHQRIRQVLAAQGACFFRELRSPGVGDTEVLEALWDLVWAGEVTNDSWAAVRATVGARSRRGRGTRSQRGRGTRSQRALPSLIGGPGRVGPVSGGLGRIGPVSGGPGRIGPVIGGPGPSGALTRGPGPAAGGAGSEAGAAAGRVTPHGLGRRPRVGALSALGPARGQGRWSLVERQIGPVEAGGTQAGLAVAGLLLGRHGVVTRDVVRAEGLPGGFAGIYPVLKAMEESGRARRGYFVTGAGGAQFALPGAVERLRDSRSGAGDGVQPAGERGLDGAAGDRGGCGAAPGAARSGPVVTILAATDPANAYGLGVAWPVKGPQRVAGAYLVLVDGTGSLYLDKGGRGLTALREVDGTWEAPAADALAQSVRSGHWGRLALARYPEELEDALLAASFVPTPRGLVCYG